ncbi:MAG: hypothetical protein JSR46_03920 [Verrucomicrobia bacterium]|nr:hypothetical protein [Verrucomicrobiota bacterium]
MNIQTLINKFFICLSVALSLFSSAHALLPPLWEGTAEIKAIFEDVQFAALLGSGELIEEIKRTETGWKIVTNKSELQVTVTYLPMDHPGPARFGLQFTRL